MTVRQRAARWINALLAPAGLELRRVPLDQPIPGSPEWWVKTQARDHRRWLRHLACRTVVDVGAHLGDFTELALRLFPEATVYAFEPLADCYRQLAARFAAERRVRTFNVALGDRSGTSELFRSEFAPSSSLLPMAAEHTNNFPFTRIAGSEVVRLERLDDVLSAQKLTGPMCVKVDVQGFEDRVIRGGERTLRASDTVVIEMSVETLYEGQPLFDRLYRQVVDLGFHYCGNLEQLLSPQDGRVLQMDAVFRRF